MKIVFVTPANALRRNDAYRIGSLLYGHSNSITGPLILGHILKDAGHDVEVYEELYAKVDYSRLSDSDVVCLYTMSCNARRAYELADTFHRKTKAHVVIGGMHASAMPEEALAYADQVIVGEGEAVILDVIEGRRQEDIVQAPCLKNLDEAPFPDYSILKTPCSTANVLSTRGCPFCCSFCSTSRMFHPYRQRSVDNVIEELRLYKNLGFKYMNFEDDNFTADKERVKEICRRMIAEDLTFNETFFFGRTDLADDDEMLSLLEQAHLTRVLVGVESLNQESLDTVNKHQKVSDIVDCTKALARHKIRLIVSLVLGVDTDGPEDIQRSVDFAKSVNAYQLQPAVMTPLPGTAVYEQLKREKRMLTDDWNSFDMMTVTFTPKKMTPWELQEQFMTALRRFYGFTSSFKIMKLFGVNYGLRRLGLWLAVRLGVLGIDICSTFVKATPYYKLKHLTPDFALRRTTLGAAHGSMQ